jgi:hypothetical protein
MFVLRLAQPRAPGILYFEIIDIVSTERSEDPLAFGFLKT